MHSIKGQNFYNPSISIQKRKKKFIKGGKDKTSEYGYASAKNQMPSTSEIGIQKSKMLRVEYEQRLSKTKISSKIFQPKNQNPIFINENKPQIV